jgi:hypothetical protein
MVTKIKSLMIHNHHMTFIDIFGHTSKGIPGIEIIGLGSYGRILKEKLIFFGKRRKLTYPPFRYVLCLDTFPLDESLLSPSSSSFQQNKEWCDLSFFILFWFLAGHLSIHQLNNCLCFGKMSIDGTIILPHPDHSIFQFASEKMSPSLALESAENPLLFVGPLSIYQQLFPFIHRHISLKQLLWTIPDIKFRWSKETKLIRPSPNQ